MTEKLRRPKIDEKKRKQIIADYRGNMPVLQIAKTYQVSLATIYRVLREE